MVYHVGVDDLTASALAAFDECQENACRTQKAAAGEIAKKIQGEARLLARAWEHLGSWVQRRWTHREIPKSHTDSTPLRAM